MTDVQAGEPGVFVDADGRVCVDGATWAEWEADLARRVDTERRIHKARSERRAARDEQRVDRIAVQDAEIRELHAQMGELADMVGLLREVVRSDAETIRLLTADLRGTALAVAA